MRQWRVIYDTPMNGAANMAADEAIMRTVAAENQPPTLRLYAWEPFCLSLGFGQRARDMDVKNLRKLGWDAVRRPTGGLAILHADELTYSVSVPKDHPIAQGGIMETYLRISQGLLNAMQILGLPVIADPQGDGDTIKGPVCFEVPSKYEITVSGKKLIGSAQMRRHGGVLQHGTLPLCGDIARICDVLSYENESDRDLAKNKVRVRAATLESAGLLGISWDAAARAVAEGMAQALEIELIEDSMSDQERGIADELYHDVYTTAERLFMR